MTYQILFHRRKIIIIFTRVCSSFNLLLQPKNIAYFVSKKFFQTKYPTSQYYPALFLEKERKNER